MTGVVRRPLVGVVADLPDTVECPPDGDLAVGEPDELADRSSEKTGAIRELIPDRSCSAVVPIVCSLT